MIERCQFCSITFYVKFEYSLILCWHLYFVDVYIGNLAEQDCLLGMEFSGRSSSGKRIMGLLAAKAICIFDNFVTYDKFILFNFVPITWL